MPNWKKVIVSGSDATLQDVTIDDWGSVSSSLASLNASSNPTLQDVTDNGSVTTNYVGIGASTSPLYSLHVKSGSDARILLQSDSDSGEGSAILFKNEDTDTNIRIKGGLFYDNKDSDEWGRGDFILATRNDASNTNVTADDWRLKVVAQTGDVHVRNDLVISGSTVFDSPVNVVPSLTASQILISSSGDDNLRIYGSGSTIMEIEGSQGILFSVTDNLIGSISSINDINGLSIFEVFSDDRVELGTYNNRGLVVSGSQIVNNTEFSGSVTITGSTSINGEINLNSHAEFISGKITVANGAVGTLGDAYSATTYAGAIVDYTVYNSGRTKQRTGTVTVTANSTTVRHSELVTTDIGSDTDGMIISSSVSSGNFSIIMDNDSGASVDVIYNTRLLKI